MFHQNSFIRPTESAVAERHSHVREILGDKLHFVKCADAELTPEDIDRLFEFQIWSRNPKQITADTLYALDVSLKEDQSQKAYRKLLHDGYIVETPTPDINTDKITSKFRHEFSFLSEFGQKRLAVILLAWKREIARLNFLEGEQQKIEDEVVGATKNGAGVTEELQEKLKAVKKELRLKPTSRIRR
jgi:hypothetical protein